MKIVYGLIIIVLLAIAIYVAKIFCFAINFASGIGGGEIYKFNSERQELYTCLKSFYHNNKAFQIPEKWSDKDLSLKPYYKDLDGLSFYFNKTANEPEEMYFVSLIKDHYSDTTFTKPSYVAVRIVYPGKRKGMDEAERKRTDTRFKKNILDKLVSDSCNCKMIGVRL